MPNGVSGASGPNAVPPAARGQESDPEHALVRSLEVTRTALEILQNLRFA